MKNLISESELLEMEQRVSAASPGPWVSFVEGRDHTSGSSFIKVGEGACRQDDIELTGATVADQDFIAAARNDMPRLLREIRILRKMLEL